METCRRCYSQYWIGWSVKDECWKRFNKYCKSTIHEQEYSSVCLECFLKVHHDGKLKLSLEDFQFLGLTVVENGGILIDRTTNRNQKEEDHEFTMEIKRHPALRRKKFS